jgi:hypothetical protein
VTKYGTVLSSHFDTDVTIAWNGKCKEKLLPYLGRQLSIMYCSVLPHRLTEDDMHINFQGTLFFRKEYNAIHQVFKAVSTCKLNLHWTDINTRNFIEKCPPISLPDKTLAHAIHCFVGLCDGEPKEDPDNNRDPKGIYFRRNKDGGNKLLHIFRLYNY